MDPSGGPLRTVVLHGKCRRVQGSMPFGGSDGLVCLFAFFRRREKYCHNGGMALAPNMAAATHLQTRPRVRGSRPASWPPSANRWPSLRENGQGPRSTSLGGIDPLICLLPTTQVGCLGARQTGRSPTWPVRSVRSRSPRPRRRRQRSPSDRRRLRAASKADEL